MQTPLIQVLYDELIKRQEGGHVMADALPDYVQRLSAADLVKFFEAIVKYAEDETPALFHIENQNRLISALGTAFYTKYGTAHFDDLMKILVVIGKHTVFSPTMEYFLRLLATAAAGDVDASHQFAQHVSSDGYLITASSILDLTRQGMWTTNQLQQAIQFLRDNDVLVYNDVSPRFIENEMDPVILATSEERESRLQFLREHTHELTGVRLNANQNVEQVLEYAASLDERAGIRQETAQQRRHQLQQDILHRQMQSTQTQSAAAVSPQRAQQMTDFARTLRRNMPSTFSPQRLTNKLRERKERVTVFTQSCRNGETLVGYKWGAIPERRWYKENATGYCYDLEELLAHIATKFSEYQNPKYPWSATEMSLADMNTIVKTARKRGVPVTLYIDIILLGLNRKELTARRVDVYLHHVCNVLNGRNSEYDPDGIDESYESDTDDTDDSDSDADSDNSYLPSLLHYVNTELSAYRMPKFPQSSVKMSLRDIENIVKAARTRRITVPMRLDLLLLGFRRGDLKFVDFTETSFNAYARKICQASFSGTSNAEE